MWALAAALGPLIGGAFTKGGQWRWLFYMNLPICGVAFALVLLLLKLPTPPGNLRDKLKRMDWMWVLLCQILHSFDCSNV